MKAANLLLLLLLQLLLLHMLIATESHPHEQHYLSRATNERLLTTRAGGMAEYKGRGDIPPTLLFSNLPPSPCMNRCPPRPFYESMPPRALQ